ncbi:MAG TPA: type II secretion system F family protein [Roseococcus sp.]|jgi:tight adherence protein C|nr:type II secretion system F family protein [Roseococcus sp.]
MDILRPENMIAIFAAFIAFATIVTLASPLMGGNRLEGRLKSVANRREELRRRSRQALAAGRSGNLRQADDSVVRKIVDRLQLSRLLEDPKVAEKLAQAGYRGSKPINRFYFFRLVGPFILAAVAAFYLYVIGLPLAPNIKLVAVVGAFTAGFYAPNIFVSNKITKRRESIVNAWPDALDLMLICVEAGMSVEAAIQKVSQEIGGRSIELAEELTLLGAELSYLPERRMAYEGLSKRVQYTGVKAVMTAMIQAERYGTPLGAALRVMAKENRDLRLTAAEKKAAALPAKLTVPMIVFLLPVLFVVILGPAVLNAMDMGTGG